MLFQRPLLLRILPSLLSLSRDALLRRVLQTGLTQTACASNQMFLLRVLGCLYLKQRWQAFRLQTAFAHAKRAATVQVVNVVVVVVVDVVIVVVIVVVVVVIVVVVVDVVVVVVVVADASDCIINDLHVLLNCCSVYG